MFKASFRKSFADGHRLKMQRGVGFQLEASRGPDGDPDLASQPLPWF